MGVWKKATCKADCFYVGLLMNVSESNPRIFSRFYYTLSTLVRFQWIPICSKFRERKQRIFCRLEKKLVQFASIDSIGLASLFNSILNDIENFSVCVLGYRNADITYLPYRQRSPEYPGWHEHKKPVWRLTHAPCSPQMLDGNVRLLSATRTKQWSKARNRLNQ